MEKLDTYSKQRLFIYIYKKMFQSLRFRCDSPSAWSPNSCHELWGLWLSGMSLYTVVFWSRCSTHSLYCRITRPNPFQHDSEQVHKAPSINTWCAKAALQAFKCPAQLNWSAGCAPSLVWHATGLMPLWLNGQKCPNLQNLSQAKVKV